MVSWVCFVGELAYFPNVKMHHDWGIYLLNIYIYIYICEYVFLGDPFFANLSLLAWFQNLR